MSWITALNCGERSIHCFSRSMALSKFFTYSAYILRKGASCAKMSPIRGVESLQEDGELKSLHNFHFKASFVILVFVPIGQRSPLAHPCLQIRQEELAVEGVDRPHVWEDALHHLKRKRPLQRLLWQFTTKHLHIQIIYSLTLTMC